MSAEHSQDIFDVLLTEYDEFDPRPARPEDAVAHFIDFARQYLKDNLAYVSMLGQAGGGPSIVLSDGRQFAIQAVDGDSPTAIQPQAGAQAAPAMGTKAIRVPFGNTAYETPPDHEHVPSNLLQTPAKRRG